MKYNSVHITLTIRTVSGQSDTRAQPKLQSIPIPITITEKGKQKTKAKAKTKTKTKTKRATHTDTVQTRPAREPKHNVSANIISGKHTPNVEIIIFFIIVIIKFTIE